MVRGQQKIQAQAKKAERDAKLKKQEGQDQRKYAQAKLTYVCPVCKSGMPDPKTYKQHFENKHPKSPLPPDLVSSA